MRNLEPPVGGDCILHEVRLCLLCLEIDSTANRLPGLQSSKQNLEEENKVYDGMMLDLTRLLVLPPLTGCPPDQGLFEVSHNVFWLSLICLVTV